MTTLRLGDNGSEVRKLQTALKRAGASLTVDGAYGPKTEQAVKNFQSDNGLTPDGICGPATWGAISLYTLDYTALTEAVEECLEAVEKLPEYKRLEAFLYG